MSFGQVWQDYLNKYNQSHTHYALVSLIYLLFVTPGIQLFTLSLFLLQERRSFFLWITFEVTIEVVFAS